MCDAAIADSAAGRGTNQTNGIQAWEVAVLSLAHPVERDNQRALAAAHAELHDVVPRLTSGDPVRLVGAGGTTVVSWGALVEACRRTQTCASVTGVAG
ncbi:MAG: hypothetical protein FWE61_05925 [Micrococcales bacterium]|nr:hypothetical protein [Micrococcales bacterium]